MSDFSHEAEKLSQKIMKIGLATLENKQVLVKSANGLNRGLVKPPFCQWVGACDEKQPRTVYYARGRKRKYQLCRSLQGCNQKTATPMYYEV